MSELVTLKVNGERHQGWTSIGIMQALNGLCSAFDLGLARHIEDGPTAWAVDEGDACELYIGKELILTGWVDTASSGITSDSLSYGAAGRDKTCDLIDCSAVPKTYRNQKLAAIVADLIKPFGLGLDVEAPTGAPFPHFVVEQGESVFDCVAKLIRLRGLLISTTNTSRVRIFSPQPKAAGYGFAEGKNAIEISVEREASDRFSDYIIIGQQKGKNVTAQDARAVKATATDPDVKRPRPLRIVSNEPSSQAGLKARADWEATSHKAAGITVNVSVPGWRAETGTLYAPGVLVPVVSAHNRLDGEFVITQVSFVLDEGSFRTDLTLAPPDAFRPEPLEAA